MTAPPTARVVFRERSAVEVLDLAVRFLVTHAASYAKVAATTLVPIFFLTLALVKKVGWDWGWPLALVAGSVAGVPFTVLVSRLAFASEVPLREVLVAALRGFPRAALLRSVAWFSALFAAVFFVLPGFWIVLVTWFTTEVALLEGGGAISSLVRAARVARASSAGALLSMLLLAFVLAGAVIGADVAGRMLLDTLLQVRPPRSLFEEGGSALGLLGFFLAVPYVATARFFAYLDARTRAEGWDVQTAFTALVAREETP